MLFNAALEEVVVGADEPGRIAGGLDELGRHGVAGGPQLDGAVVDGVGAAKNVRHRIGAVAPSADVLEVERAARLEVAKEHVLASMNFFLTIWRRRMIFTHRMVPPHTGIVRAVSSGSLGLKQTWIEPPARFTAPGVSFLVRRGSC
jgi:hypothetical protein